ncbi:hypothetical protein FKP32DRAFT_1682153 [Trametes sanguinea]|nr:hypothetical protein FKP32DRAFT_1682153 [Trametes sanguinea]
MDHSRWLHSFADIYIWRKDALSSTIRHETVTSMLQGVGRSLWLNCELLPLFSLNVLVHYSHDAVVAVAFSSSNSLDIFLELVMAMRFCTRSSLINNKITFNDEARDEGSISFGDSQPVTPHETASCIFSNSLSDSGFEDDGWDSDSGAPALELEEMLHTVEPEGTMLDYIWFRIDA